jgi:hypothetical protein
MTEAEDHTVPARRCGEPSRSAESILDHGNIDHDVPHPTQMPFPLPEEAAEWIISFLGGGQACRAPTTCTGKGRLDRYPPLCLRSMRVDYVAGARVHTHWICLATSFREGWLAGKRYSCCI